MILKVFLYLILLIFSYNYTPRNDSSDEQEVHSTTSELTERNSSILNGPSGSSIPVITSNGNTRDNFRRSYNRASKIRRRNTYNRKNRGVLFLKNLCFNIDEGDLRRIFGGYGRILNIAVHRNTNGNSLGSGEVVFMDIRDASRAQHALSGYRGMMINIVPGL
nr:RNA binding protein fox-1 homolog 2-like [Onthophagus taurus]